MAKPLSPRGHDRQLALGSAPARPHTRFTSPTCGGGRRRGATAGGGKGHAPPSFPLPIPPPQAGEGVACSPLSDKHPRPARSGGVNEPKTPWLARLSAGLKRTASALGGAISDLVSKRPLDAATIEELEDVLIRADLGVEVAGRIAAAVAEGRYDKTVAPEEVKRILAGEVEKIVRAMKKIDAATPHAVLLVLDATVGQNALSQVEEFAKTAGVTGLVMTKLDGTARGGILVAIAAKHRIPV